MSEPGKLLAAPKGVVYAVDGVAAVGVVGSLMDILPKIAALLAIVWYVVQLYESKTGQKFIRRVRALMHGESKH